MPREIAINSYPKIAILLATFNGLKYLPEQIMSLLNQEHVRIKIFINDDFSTDGTWLYLNSLNNDNIIILPKTKNFKSASGNFFHLIQEVDFNQYDFVCLCDQDDVWYADKLRASVKALIDHNADVCSSDVMAFWGEMVATSKQKYICKSQPIGKWNHHFEAAGPGCTYLIKTNVALKIKSFLKSNEILLLTVSLHDWLIFSYVKSQNLKWYILPQATVYYRQHTSNVIGVNSGLQSYWKRILLLYNGWYLQQVLLIANICKTENDDPIIRLKNLNFNNLIFLICRIRQMRRKQIDQIILIIYFIFLYLRRY